LRLRRTGRSATGSEPGECGTECGAEFHIRAEITIITIRYDGRWEPLLGTRPVNSNRRRNSAMANNEPDGGGYQGYAGQSYAGYGSDINSIRNRLAMAQLQAGMYGNRV
jgi:hypothetical protein